MGKIRSASIKSGIVQTHKRITDNKEVLVSFVAFKKTIALVLLTMFVVIAIYDA